MNKNSTINAYLAGSTIIGDAVKATATCNTADLLIKKDTEAASAYAMLAENRARALGE